MLLTFFLLTISLIELFFLNLDIPEKTLHEAVLNGMLLS